MKADKLDLEQAEKDAEAELDKEIIEIIKKKEKNNKEWNKKKEKNKRKEINYVQNYKTT